MPKTDTYNFLEKIIIVEEYPRSVIRLILHPLEDAADLSSEGKNVISEDADHQVSDSKSATFQAARMTAVMKYIQKFLNIWYVDEISLRHL